MSSIPMLLEAMPCLQKMRLLTSQSIPSQSVNAQGRNQGRVCGYWLLEPGWHKDADFGSYLHHGPNNQRHLSGYKPKWWKDLGMETKEKEGTVEFQAHAVGHNSLLSFSRRRKHSVWTSLLWERVAVRALEYCADSGEA